MLRNVSVKFTSISTLILLYITPHSFICSGCSLQIFGKYRREFFRNIYIYKERERKREKRIIKVVKGIVKLLLNYEIIAQISSKNCQPQWIYLWIVDDTRNVWKNNHRQKSIFLLPSFYKASFSFYIIISSFKVVEKFH